VCSVVRGLELLLHDIERCWGIIPSIASEASGNFYSLNLIRLFFLFLFYFNVSTLPVLLPFPPYSFPSSPPRALLYHLRGL